ncbi:hypothetical protein [Streptomyces sp. 900105245]
MHRWKWMDSAQSRTIAGYIPQTALAVKAQVCHILDALVRAERLERAQYLHRAKNGSSTRSIAAPMRSASSLTASP